MYQFSALNDGQSIAFNPNADVLNFDQTTVAAADLRVTTVGTNIRIDVVGGPQTGKDVTLQNVSQLQLATTNITFADGSKLLFGDNSTAQNDDLANSLTGTAGRRVALGNLLFKRASDCLATPLTVSKLPPMTILASDCTTTA